MPTQTIVESGFGKKLASSDKAVREKALKTLQRWLLSRHNSFTAASFLTLWKALFYSVWMADKPAYQQDLSDRLAAMFESLYQKDPAMAIEYARAFWQTMAREWPGIDRFRLDKFYYLVKIFLHYHLVVMSESGWDIKVVEKIMEIITSEPLSMKASESIRVCIIEHFFSILNKISPGQSFSASQTLSLFNPIVLVASIQPKKSVLRYLEKFFVNNVLNAATKKGDIDGGRLCFDTSLLKQSFFNSGSDPNTPFRNRKLLYSLHSYNKS